MPTTSAGHLLTLTPSPNPEHGSAAITYGEVQDATLCAVHPRLDLAGHDGTYQRISQPWLG